MELLSLAPFSSGSVTWQPKPGAHALTVVCKATYDLAPAECALSASQEPLYESDQHEGDDPKRSVRVPADLLPAKPRCDITLVGHAHAPRGETASKLTARVIIGLVDKEIEIRADGSRTFLRSSLEPLGLGPLAMGSPSRLVRLRTRSLAMAERWRDDPLPADFDLGFFNAAPADQQVTMLRANEQLILHGLSADHPRLVTSLPGIRPRALVQRADGMTTELAMKADSLWIDTDRAICTLVWRAEVELERPDEEGRVVIASERAGERLDFGDILRLAGPVAPVARESAAVPATVRRRINTLQAVVASPSPEQDASPPWLASPRSTPVPPPPIHVRQDPPPAMVRLDAGTDLARAAYGGTLAASNAAAAATTVSRRAKSDTFPKLATVAKPAPAPAPAHPDPIELLWRDPEKAQQSEAEVIEALTATTPLDCAGVERAMSAAIGVDGSFRAPVVLVAGELRMPFDEVETLRATIAAATPLASGDKRLRDAIDAVREVIDRPNPLTPSLAESLTQRVRDAFTHGDRILPAGYLTGAAEGLLLELRHYQKRVLFGDTWLRGILAVGGDAMVVYLPASIATHLPMLPSMRVRLVAEARPQQDYRETHRFALKTLAVARLLDLSSH